MFGGEFVRTRFGRHLLLQKISKQTAERIERIFETTGLNSNIYTNPPISRVSSSMLRQSKYLNDRYTIKKTAFQYQELDWYDGLRPYEFIGFYLVALCVGHLLDKVNKYAGTSIGVNKGIDACERKKKIFVQGELKEYEDAWTPYYPEANLRSLASAYVWAGLIAACVCFYVIGLLM